MKSRYGIEILFLSLLLIFSCSSEPEADSDATENLIPQYQITLADSFGTEIGDSIHIIGSIDDFCYSPDGSVLILDCTAQVIRDFSSENGSKTHCNSGEGPGELLYPLSLCALENGHFLVADEMKQEIMEYTAEGDYLGSFYYSGGYVPYSMYPVDAEYIQADMLTFDMDCEVPQYVYTICGIHSGDTEVAQEYFSLSWDWTSADFYRDIELLEFTGSSSGTLFLVPDVTDYRVKVFSMDGEIISEIEGSMERLRKTEEQIQTEIEEFEEWAQQDQAYMGGYRPSEYEAIISVTGVDANGYLWVKKHDSADAYSFDVWDCSGELIAQAQLHKDPEKPQLEFRINEYGLLAANVDSEEYPRVYYFEVGVE